MSSAWPRAWTPWLAVAACLAAPNAGCSDSDESASGGAPPTTTSAGGGASGGGGTAGTGGQGGVGEPVTLCCVSA